MIVQLSKEYLRHKAEIGLRDAELFNGDDGLRVMLNGCPNYIEAAIVLRAGILNDTPAVYAFAQKCVDIVKKYSPSADTTSEDGYTQDSFLRTIHEDVMYGDSPKGEYILIVFIQDELEMEVYGIDQCVEKIISISVNGKSIYEQPDNPAENMIMDEEISGMSAWPADVVSFFNGKRKYTIAKTELNHLAEHLITNISTISESTKQLVREYCGDWMINSLSNVSLTNHDTIGYYEIALCLNDGSTSFKQLPTPRTGWANEYYNQNYSANKTDYITSIDICVLSFTCKLAHNTPKKDYVPDSYILIDNIFISVGEYDVFTKEEE